MIATAAANAFIRIACSAPRLATLAGADSARRPGGCGSERQCEAALPGDVVLSLVEPVPVELVDEVATLRPDADAPEAVLDARAEITCELGPLAVRLELMDADGADPAEQVRRQRGGPRLDGIPQHQVCVITELVELAAAREHDAAKAILRPAAAGAEPQVPV